MVSFVQLWLWGRASTACLLSELWCPKLRLYHSTYEMTYSGFILGEFDFVIISVKVTGQNSVKNYLCYFRVFLQISVSPVPAVTDSKPGQVED